MLCCCAAQLHAALCHEMSPAALGLSPGGALVSTLRQRVIALASNGGVIATVRRAAQALLQRGWSVLLPTGEERARALSSLLPSIGEFCRPFLSAA